MTAVMVEMRAPVLRLVCTKCGAAGSAGCNHGVEFLVKASDRALLEVQKNPELSNRAIAAKAGVSRKTVDRVRPVGTNGPTDPPKRTGKDGKKYKARKAPKPKPEKGRMPLTEEPCTDCNTSAERWERSCSMMLGEMLSLRAYWNKEFGAWDKFPVPSSLAKLARQAADELTQLANQLEKSK